MPDQLIGAADGDKGGDKGGSAFTTNVTPVTSTTTFAPVTIVGKRLPKRPNNPLSNFSISTYHLTLYMVSPDAYNAFVQSGRKNINAKTPGAYIIAQSGGTPKSDPSTRASGFELDFYLDNLKITTVLPAASPTTTALSFSITEPYGFSFITKLNQALATIRSVSAIPGYSTSTATFNPTRQFFILSVGFRGYDSNGKVMTNSDIASQNALTTESGAVFDHFYEIIITSMKFKLDGKETKYDITAATLAPTTSFGINRGTVAEDITVVAEYVADAIGGNIDSDNDPPGIHGLLTQINDAQKKLLNPPVDVKNNKSDASKPKLTYPNIYKVKWAGSDTDQATFKKATLKSPADTSKENSPGVTISNSSGSTEKAAQKAALNVNVKNVMIRSGTSIIAAITQIMKFSSWVEDSLKIIQASKPEQDSETENAETITAKAEYKWFNISSDVEIIGWNDQQNDFAYKITYTIGPYAIPATATSFSKAPKKYYGAYKRYDYWLTGKNSEVIKIEQQFDNAYFNTMFMGEGGNDGVSNNPNFKTNVEQQGREGVGTVNVDATITRLRDPNAYTKTKIQILGDPDYLMPDSSQSSGYYTEDGYTLNPSGGQQFIEISYKEAQDYMNSTGTLKVNGNIEFFPYSKAVRDELKGAMSYMLVSVVSTFSKGSFTQELTTAINTFPNYASAALTTPERGASSEGDTGGEAAAKANMTGTTLNSALTSNVQAVVDKVSSVTIPTQTGQVADDDAAPSQADNAGAY
jgi:hypothetical protein